MPWGSCMGAYPGNVPISISPFSPPPAPPAKAAGLRASSGWLRPVVSPGRNRARLEVRVSGRTGGGVTRRIPGRGRAHRVRLVSWQNDPENRTKAWLGSDVDPPTHCLNHALRDREAEAGAARLRREKWNEEIFENVRGDA